jgi:hypothetical protein
MSDNELLVIPETLLVQLVGGQIEEMPLDEYLKGVVPTEIGQQKPMEALKAQAIAARSYAISTRRHALQGFDVCTTTHCQAYKAENRYPDSDTAVDETSGLVVTHNGQVVSAPFFGHCDGHTRNSEDVWSSAAAHLRSVPCICGSTELYGHGVGMCQRGAVAMAQEGILAIEILKHYYTGVEIMPAEVIPRTSFKRSVILGQVVDSSSNPRGGVALMLTGPLDPIRRRTNDKGQFWVSGLPAGEWELIVRDKPIHYSHLLTDGRNAINLQVVVPDTPPLKARTMPLAYPHQLIGTLGYDGVPVLVTDPVGNEQTVLSGSAEEYNPGGFVANLIGAGTYHVQLLEQSFDLEVGDAGLWVQFSTEEA